MGQLRRNWSSFIGGTFHLINVPIGCKQAGVDQFDIGSDAFYFLHVPKREGIIVANGKHNRIGVARF